jgi:hypothetical protein
MVLGQFISMAPVYIPIFRISRMQSRDSRIISEKVIGLPMDISMVESMISGYIIVS